MSKAKYVNISAPQGLADAIDFIFRSVI